MPGRVHPLGWGLPTTGRARRDELRTGSVEVAQITRIVPESDWRSGLELVNAGPSPLLVSHQLDDLRAVPPRGLRIAADQVPVPVPPGGTLWGSAQYSVTALRCGFSHYPTHQQTVEIASPVMVGIDEAITVTAWVLAPAGAPFYWAVSGRTADLSGGYAPAVYNRRVGTGAWEKLTATVTASSYFAVLPADAYRPALLVQSDFGWTDFSGTPATNLNANGWNYGACYVDYLDVRLSNGSQLIADPGFDTGDTSNLVVSSAGIYGPPNREFTYDRTTSTRPLRWTCYLDTVGGATDTDAAPPTGSSVSAGVLSIPAAGNTHSREVWSEALRATAGQTWTYQFAWTNPAGLSHSIIAVGAYNAAGAWISDVYFVDDVTVGARGTTGTFVTPANTATLRVRLHNYQNTAGTITFGYARLLLTTPAASNPAAAIAGKDGFRGAATVTYAETVSREY